MRYVITFKCEYFFIWNSIPELHKNIFHIRFCEDRIFQTQEFFFIGEFSYLLCSKIKNISFWSNFWKFNIYTCILQKREKGRWYICIFQ
jgi:hypothetical protein